MIPMVQTEFLKMKNLSWNFYLKIEANQLILLPIRIYFKTNLNLSVYI